MGKGEEAVAASSLFVCKDRQTKGIIFHFDTGCPRNPENFTSVSYFKVYTSQTFRKVISRNLPKAGESER